MNTDKNASFAEQQEETLKSSLKDTMVKVNAMSNIIADNVINIGNLSKKEQDIADEIVELRQEYKDLVLEYNETEYLLNQSMVEEPGKIKKHDKYYKKIAKLRDERLKIISHIKDHEQDLAATQVGKEGSSQAHVLLEKEYDRLVKKMQNAKKNFPTFYADIRAEIAKNADKMN